jgi:glycosyltransferase involved in cell wall biosynthesis
MHRKPLVSILISSYNYETFLGTCIESALNQTYSPIEVIVVDDGSVDDSKAIMDSYGGKINAIYQENKGPMAAFNTGFAASCGEIICFLDSDDYFLPGKIARMVEVFKYHPGIDWFFHRLNVVDTSGAVKNLTRLKKTGKLEVQKYITRSGIMPVGNTGDSGLCFSRSLFQKMYPLPQERPLSVTDRYLKAIACATTKGYFDDQPLGAMRVHGQNIMSGSKNQQKISKIIRITISNAYWLQKKWPILSRYSNKIIGQGIGLFHKTGDIDPYHNRLLEKYLSAASLQDRLEIKLFEFYYRNVWNPG